MPHAMVGVSLRRSAHFLRKGGAVSVSSSICSSRSSSSRINYATCRSLSYVVTKSNSSGEINSSIRGRKLSAGIPPVSCWSVLAHSPTLHFNYVRRFASGSVPTHTKVPLPALSPTMERGSIKSWEKKEGDKLSEGDLLALIETDKATMDFETPEEGYLAKILVPGGSKDVSLGQTVCIIVQNQEDVAAFKNFSPEDAQRPSESPASTAKDVKESGQDQKTLEDKPPGASSSSKYPAHMEIKLPALSPTVDQSTIKRWDKKEGDKLSEGDLIAQVETDKATIDWNWENPEEVYIAKIFVPDGSADVPVGQLVAIFVSSKDDLAAFTNAQKGDFAGSSGASQSAKKQSEDVPTKETPKKAAKDTSHEERVSGQEGGRVAASPLARSLAKSKGIDITNMRGTGPDGRIVAEDVHKSEPASTTKDQPKKETKAAAKSAAPQALYQDIPMTNMRQVIAKRLVYSKQTVPHYYISVDVELDELMSLRKQLNDMLEKEKVKISVNDFVIKACAMACKKVPQANSAWMETFIRQYDQVDVSMAVATEAGLITPIIFNADTKGLVEINADVIRLADSARKGKLKPHEFQGGTFTVSNLGSFDIKHMVPVINPPQACILGAPTAYKQVLPDEKSKEGFRIATVMNVTLSCDHRVIDGAVGAQWLKHFKRCLELPESMLL